MARRLVSRVGLLALTVLGVATITFVLQFVLPGDPARALAPRFRNVGELDRIRRQLHLDDPLWAQYVRYLGNLLRGDLGASYVRQEAVSTLIFARLSSTLLLAAAGVVAEVLIGVPLGMWSALSPSGRRAAAVLNLVLLSIPAFVIGLVLLLVFGFWIQLFPVMGGRGIRQLMLPAITLGLGGVPYYAQIVSEEMTQALASSYARTAVGKGLPNRWILVHHISRNVLPPVITMVGLDLGMYISGVVVVETVFGWPGIGQLAVQALDDMDRPVVLGIALLASVGVGVFNFAADLVRMFIDPRTRVVST